ncbi:hypothetical protein Tco_0400135, partial [Tanacetum coccineum]
NEYAVLDRRLDIPYSVEVDTSYRVVIQNSVKGGFQLERLAQVGEAGRRHLAQRVCFFVFSSGYLLDGEFFKSAGKRPAIKASYSASLLVALNLNLRAYVNSIPSGFVIIRPPPEPSMHDDPSVNNTHGFGSYSLSSIIISRGSSSGCSTMKSARIYPLTDEGSLLLMAMRLLVLISLKWSATTTTRGDILLGSAELQEIKTTRTRKAQEGVCLWKHLLPQFVSVMGLWICQGSGKEGPNYALDGLLISNSDSSYKTGLKSVEEKLEFYKKNESVYVEKINGLKWDIQIDPKSSHDDGSKPLSDDGKKVNEDPRKDSECNDQEKEDNVNNTKNVNAASTNKVNAVGRKTSIELPFDLNMPALEDYSIFDFSRNDEDDGAEADNNNYIQ